MLLRGPYYRVSDEGNKELKILFRSGKVSVSIEVRPAAHTPIIRQRVVNAVF
jgi:hypothetical protein